MLNRNHPTGPQGRDQMHPDDLRNLFIFFAVAAALYFFYNAYVLEPQSKAMRERALAESQLAEAGVPLGALAAQEIKPRGEIIAAGSRLAFDNGEIFGTINLRGGRIDDLSLHHYFKTMEDKEKVNVLSPKQSAFQRSVEYGWVAANGAQLSLPGPDTLWQAQGGPLKPGAPVTLSWSNGQGLVFKRQISLDEHYMFTINEEVINNSGRAVTLHPYGLISQKGMPSDFGGTWISHEGPVGYAGGELFQDSYGGLRKENKQIKTADHGWLGITDKYWLSALIPPQGESVKYSYNYSGPTKDKDNQGLYQADYLAAAVEIAPGQSREISMRLYAGAKKVPLLQKYEVDQNIPKFDLAVDFGWFWFMTKPFFYALHYLGLWFGNMGAAIIVVTIMIRGAVFPLTNISYRSFAKMKKVTPQVVEMRKAYGDDKTQLQQELIKLYQREGVNPVSGCFPMLLQIPIFFALYKTFFVTIELRHAPFFGWIQDLSAPDPTSLFNLFGLIPWDPPGFLMIGVWPCLMLVAMLIQKNLNPPPQDPIQRDMATYMPFMITYIMAHFASGLVVYWTFSAFITIIQQIIIMKSLDVPIHLFGESEAEEKLHEQIDKGPAVHPLAEMAEDEAEEALFGDDDAGDKKLVSKPKPKKSKKKK